MKSNALKYNLMIFVATIVCLMSAGDALSQNSSRSIRTYGLAVPAQQVQLRSAIDGHVRELFASEGTSVKKGDVVVQLECRPAQASLKIAQLEANATGLLENAAAELETARSNFRRLESLHRQDVASSQEFSEAKLRFKRAEARLKIEQERLEASQAKLELAKAELDRFYLRAPFDGQVVQVQVTRGASVSKTKDLIQIVSLSKYRVDLYLPVEQANKLVAYTDVAVQITAPFKQEINAKIVFLSPLIEAATGTTRVTLEIDNVERKLPSGFTVSLTKDIATMKTVSSHK